MLEIQKSKRLSTPGSCSILSCTRGNSRTNGEHYHALNNSNIPFHFIVVRPSSLGIVLKMEFLSQTTLLGYIQSTSAPVGSAINEIFSSVSEIFQSPDMLYFDSSITRYIADVINIDSKSSSWIIDKVKSLIPSQLFRTIQHVLQKYRGSENIIKYLIQLLHHDLLWGTSTFSPFNDHNNQSRGIFQGIFSTLLMKEYSTLIIRERYSFIKTLFISLLIILDIDKKSDTYKDELFQVIN